MNYLMMRFVKEGFIPKQVNSVRYGRELTNDGPVNLILESK